MPATASRLDAHAHTRSGIFDTPPYKCPPPLGGSPACVTDSLASPFPLSDPPPTSFSKPVRYSLSPTLPITPGSTPNSSTESLQLSQLAPYPAGTGRINSTAFRQPAPSSIPATPPLTPDSGSGTGIAALAAKHNHEALDLLQALFPRDALKALPFTRSVKIQSNGLGAVWNGIILDMPVKGGDSRKTLYVDGKGAEHVQLRERYARSISLRHCIIGLTHRAPALLRFWISRTSASDALPS